MSDRYPVHITIFDLKGGRKGRQIDARKDLMWGWPNEENVAEYAMTYLPKNDPDRVIEVDDGSLVWRFRTGRLAGQRTVRLLGKSASKSRAHATKSRAHATKKAPAQLDREIAEVIGHWEEDPFGHRFITTSDGIRFDTAGVDPTYYRDPKWRQRWEFDLKREIEKLKAGKSTKLYKMSETHYRLPGTV